MTRTTRATMALLALAALLPGCRGTPRSAQAATRPADPNIVRIDSASGKLAYVRTVPVAVRHDRVIASLPAEVVMDEDHTVRVLTPVAGRIRSVDVSQGTSVAAGTPLARITSGDLAQAVSDVQKARAASEQSDAALTRERDLWEHHVAALKDVEQARSDAQQARAELQRAQARLSALGASGSAPGADYVLRAPLAGVVVERSANPGAEVRPDNGASLFTITSLNDVWLKADVYQRDLAAIHPGVELEFTTDAVPGRTFQARVTYVAGTLDPQTRTALVRATIPNPGHVLRALETGTARVLAPDPTPALVVPTRALVTHGTETVVFVQTAPGVFVRRPVTVGDDDGTTAVITSGVSLGDPVVVDGSLLLEGESELGS